MNKKGTYTLFFIILTMVFLFGCDEKPGVDNETLGEMISIDGVDVSGMSIGDAYESLTYAHEQMLAGTKYVIKTDKAETVDIKASELPFSFNVQKALEEAFSLEPYQISSGEPRTLRCQIAYNEEEGIKIIDSKTKALYRDPVDAKAVYDPNAAEGFKFVKEQPGLKADIQDINMQIAQSVIEGNIIEINAKMLEVTPEYTLERAKMENTLVSEFSTSYAKSPHNNENRVYNIKKGADMIDGVRLNPGEEFDTNDILGPRNEKNGWKEAPGIRNGKYEQEFGGGICQVSSTLYNAVLMADLEITDRQHHSWPMGYVPIGRDATISTDGPNLKFKNNGDTPITISAKTDDENLTITISIYGTALKDGMSIKLSSDKIDTLPEPEPEFELDSGLPYNTKVKKRDGRAGSVSETYKEYYDSNGKLLKRKLVSKDTYKPISAIVQVSEDIYYQQIWNNVD